MIPSNFIFPQCCDGMLWTQLMLRMFSDGSGVVQGSQGWGWVTIINTRYNLATQLNPQIAQIKVELSMWYVIVNEF